MTSDSTLPPNARVRSHTRRTGWFRRLCGDLVMVARRDNKWWIVPLVILVLALAGLLAVATVAGPLAPFIYPLL